MVRPQQLRGRKSYERPQGAASAAAFDAQDHCLSQPYRPLPTGLLDYGRGNRLLFQPAAPVGLPSWFPASLQSRPNHSSCTPDSDLKGCQLVVCAICSGSSIESGSPGQGCDNTLAPRGKAEKLAFDSLPVPSLASHPYSSSPHCYTRSWDLPEYWPACDQTCSTVAMRLLTGGAGCEHVPSRQQTEESRSRLANRRNLSNPHSCMFGREPMVCRTASRPTRKTVAIL